MCSNQDKKKQLSSNKTKTINSCKKKKKNSKDPQPIVNPNIRSVLVGASPPVNIIINNNQNLPFKNYLAIQIKLINNKKILKRQQVRLNQNLLVKPNMWRKLLVD